LRVLVADALDEAAIQLLKESGHEVTEEEASPEELLQTIGNYDALIVRSRTKVTSAVIEAGKTLKVIGRAGVGVDNIDVDAATKQKIPVVYAPTGSTQSVAEHTWAMIFAAARRISVADRTMKHGQWAKKELEGIELFGKTFGFVGSGRIGAAVAKIAQAMNMKTISYDPYLPPEIAEKVGIQLSDLETVLKTSDVLSIHAALTPETKRMIGKDQLALMKPSAILVNCARGGIVDEEALYEALKSQKLAAAALDVFEVEPPKESPLLELENIVLSPHIAASTKDAQRKAGTITAEQINLVLKGETPKFCVNQDEIY
jgi:D-3-phosphoglycerate dehydrogenase